METLAKSFASNKRGSLFIFSLFFWFGIFVSLRSEFRWLTSRLRRDVNGLTLSHHHIISFAAEVRVGCESMIQQDPRLLFTLGFLSNLLVKYIGRRQSQGRSGSRRCGWRQGRMDA